MRCVQPAEYLTDKGWSASAGCIYSTYPSARQLIVLHRTKSDAITNKVLKLAKSEGLKVIYDVDDLIFDEGGEEHLSSFTRAKGVTNTRRDIHKSYLNAMQKADLITVSTNFLKSRVEKFHSPCVVMKNGLSQSFVDQAQSSGPLERSTKDDVNIGYFSGSAHHDADFKIVEPALIEILKNFPNTTVTLGGKLNYSDIFLSFGGRFRFEPFKDYSSFIRTLGQLDVNLVPLDIKSDFAQARSELKYIEAGAFAIPTISSPTQTYSEAIKNGHNGLLCQEDSWYGAISSLVQDAIRRRSLGEEARRDVLNNYGPVKRAEEWSSLINELLEDSTSVGRNVRRYSARLQIAGSLVIGAWRRKLRARKP